MSRLFLPLMNETSYVAYRWLFATRTRRQIESLVTAATKEAIAGRSRDEMLALLDFEGPGWLVMQVKCCLSGRILDAFAEACEVDQAAADRSIRSGRQLCNEDLHGAACSDAIVSPGRGGPILADRPGALLLLLAFEQLDTGAVAAAILRDLNRMTDESLLPK